MFYLPAFLATAVNPALVALLLPAPFLTPGRVGRWEFWGRSALGISFAVAVAESSKHYQFWSGHPNFPSGHETLGLAVAASLAVRDLRWLALALPLTALLAWALIAAQYHQPIEVVAAIFVGPPCALLCHLWKNRANR